MAGKNEVTLTFAGDADKLEKEIRRAADSTGDLEAAFDRVGTAAKGMDTSLGGVGAGTERVNKVIGEGGRQFGDYGKGLGGLGDRADEVDTRMMGMSDGIQGVTDLMRAETLAPHEFAMAFSDLGSAAYNSVIPSLQGVVGVLGGAGGLVAGLGAAGAAVAAVGWGVKSYTDTQREAKETTEDWTRVLEGNADAVNVASDRYAAFKLEQSESGDVLKETGADMDVLTEAVTGNLDQLDQFERDMDAILSQGFDKYLKSTGTESTALTTELLALREQMSAGEWSQLVRDLDDQAEGHKSATDAIREQEAEQEALEVTYASLADSAEAFNDALQAQQDQQRALVDPLFGMLTATNDLAGAKDAEAAAQEALNEALAGSDPTAIAEAQRGLEDAHLDVADAAYGEQAAQERLMGALSTGQTTVADMRAQVDALERSGRLSGDSAAYLRDQINSVESKHVTISLSGYESVKAQLDTLYSTLSAMPESKSIRLGYSSYGVAELNRFRALGGGYNGAIVPGYAAGGGLSWSSGPRGTDRVPMWLTPGEMVLNKGQQANLFDAIDSGALGGAGQQSVVNVNVAVAGSIRSDRDLVKVIRDELARGGMRGTLR